MFIVVKCRAGEPADLYDETNPAWVPTEKMGHDISDQQPDNDRYNQAQNRKRRKLEDKLPNTQMAMMMMTNLKWTT